MTHRGPFQPRPFCDSVISLNSRGIFMILCVRESIQNSLLSL